MAALEVESGKILLVAREESVGGGDTPTTGSKGGGKLSVGVASRRFDTPSCSSTVKESEGVWINGWGSKGGGNKLSSV